MIYYRVIHKSAVNNGKINSWSEKRAGFVEWVEQKYGKVFLLGSQEVADFSKDDILFLEFGSSNSMMFGNQINYTYDLAKKFKGKIIYLNDDPDLFTSIKPINHRISLTLFSGSPSYASKFVAGNITYFPFDCFLPKSRYNANYTINKGVYYGKDDEGRADFLGKCKMFADFYGCFDNELPKISRKELLKKYKFGITTSSNKHIKINFRTGRLFHYLASGLPSVIDGRCLMFGKYKQNLFDVIKSPEKTFNNQFEIWQDESYKQLNSSLPL